MPIIPGSSWVLITGCTPGGIGHALALEFFQRGCHVIATGRSLETLKPLTEVGIHTVLLEVGESSSVLKCKAEVETLTHGKLDILINNAGVTHTIPALDIDIEDVKRTFDANVFGPMLMCQAFASLLIATRGLIINVSSVSSCVVYPFGAVYSATKGALNAYSRTLRAEIKPFGVRVMVTLTGTVRSNIASRTHRSLPPWSLYKPVEDFFVKRLTFSQTYSFMHADLYAKGVVDEALKGEGYLYGWIGRTPDWYWGGGRAAGARFLSSWLPTRIAEAIEQMVFKMPAMARRLQETRNAKRS